MRPRVFRQFHSDRLKTLHKSKQKVSRHETSREGPFLRSDQLRAAVRWGASDRYYGEVRAIPEASRAHSGTLIGVGLGLSGVRTFGESTLSATQWLRDEVKLYGFD
jgi:hypothetical protein